MCLREARRLKFSRWLACCAFSIGNELVDTSEQVTNVGLDNVSISSSLMAHLLISLTTRAGKEKDRCVQIVAAHLTTQFKTVEIRKPAVQQIQVEVFCLNS